MSCQGDTRELWQGTAKMFAGRVPGYTGTLAGAAKVEGPPGGGSAVTAVALRHSADHCHTQSKAFGLWTTHQFSYHLPGYQGTQPRTSANNKVHPEGSFSFLGRRGTTTEAFHEQVANKDTLRKTAAKQAATRLMHPVHQTKVPHFGTSSETVKFFTAGVETASDNGRANAEAFFKTLRPLEGLPRRHQPSATTVNGYLFDCYTSRVN